MPIVQKLKSVDNLFHRVGTKIILNDLKLHQDIRELIYTEYEDKIELIPKCECGYYKGGYLKGYVCPKCGHKAQYVFDDIKPFLWVRKFRDDLPFMSPKYWLMLSNTIHTGIDSLYWLSNPNYNPSKVPTILYNIKTLIGGRRYSKVINNIDKIIEFLLNTSTYKHTAKYKKLEMLLEMYRTQKDEIFSNHLPIINKKMIIIEKNHKGRFTFELLPDLIDLAVSCVDLANDTNITDVRLEARVAGIVHRVGQLFLKYLKEIIISNTAKNGLMRKYLYGTRSHFSFRDVISSLNSKYEYDTIHVPWYIGVVVFRPHLMNKLVNKHKYSVKEASKLLYRTIRQYNPLIDKLLQELIDESPYKGIPVLANRNPTLGMGSIQKVYITKFKKDPNDTTISISILIAKAFNADFDGDEMNFKLLEDNKLSKLLDGLSPHYNVPDLDIYKVSGNINLPKTSITTLSNYLLKEEKPINNNNDDVYNELFSL